MVTLFDSPTAVSNYLNNEKLECLLCGRTFKSLGNHLVVHGITVRQYQEQYGLPYSKGLSGTTRTEKLSKALLARYADKSFSLEHVTPVFMARMTEKGRKTKRSKYKSMTDKLMIEKAISASVAKRKSKTTCLRGHPFPVSDANVARYCYVCHTLRRRKATGGLPREIAMKTVVDSACSLCATPMKVSKIGKRKNQKCRQCKKEYMRNYDANRDKDKLKLNCLKRKQKKLELINEIHNSREDA